MDCPDCNSDLSPERITGAPLTTYRCDDCGVTIEIHRDRDLPDGVTSRGGGSSIHIAPGVEVGDYDL